tara:strand:+ start:125 stop:703 length:579 start_codon:yes stop_codon:yes gene_type:complete
MAIDKITSAGITTDAVGPTQLNEAANYAFTGTVTGAGGAFSPRFQATISGSNQTINNNAETVIAFNNEVFDEGGCFNNTSSTVTLNGISTPAYSFAPNVAGIYLVSARQFNQTGTGSYYDIGYLYKNTTLIDEHQRLDGFGGNINHVVTKMVSMNGTSDYLNYRRYHNFGSSKITYQGSYNTFFEAVLIKAT